jgi:Flp pilus assembly protein TadD
MESLSCREIFLIVGNNRDARTAAMRRLLGPGVTVHEDRSAADWPFRRLVTPEATQVFPDRTVVWIRDLHEAFPASQAPGTRLVLTQGTYRIEHWHAWQAANAHVRIVADADASILGAEPLLAGRGAWRRQELLFVARDGRVGLRWPLPDDEGADLPEPRDWTPMQAAFRQADPEVRLLESRRAADEDPGNPALLLCIATSCMEMGRLDEAQTVLEHALEVAPDWEAVHFEYGKLWLRRDDTARAAAAFANAGRLMPTFSTAFINLGAALGELGRHQDALDALVHAREFDPRSHTLSNNIGVVYRELGRLEDAGEAFREAIGWNDDFVFARYNLAHTLFLQGRFRDAADVYQAGMRRDPQKNPRQACRLAVARAAAGDSSGAIADLDALAARVPPETLCDLMEEAESTLTALSAIAGVDAGGVARVLDRVRDYSS